LIAPAKFWLFECSPADGTGAAAKQAGLRHALVGRSIDSLSEENADAEARARFFEPMKASPGKSEAEIRDMMRAA
jgi:hypothetical protein